jgi:hypothetical protein
MKVECFKCHDEFSIQRDQILLPFEYLLRECDYLVEKKLYTRVVLNLCQAYENFFALWLNINLVHPISQQKKPALQADFDFKVKYITIYSEVTQEFYRQTDGFSFCELRNTFIRRAINATNEPQRMHTLADMPNYSELSKEITAPVILPNNVSLASSLNRLLATNINQARNDVVRKFAERPPVWYAQEQHLLAEDLIFDLSSLLEFNYKLDDIRNFFETFFPYLSSAWMADRTKSSTGGTITG